MEQEEKLTACWLLLDLLARLPVEAKQLPVGRLVHKAQLLLRRQEAPGWKEESCPTNR